MAEDDRGVAGSDELGPTSARDGEGDSAPYTLPGSRELVPIAAGPTPASAGLDDATIDLPPEAIARLSQKAPPQRAMPRRPQPAAAPSGWRRPPLWAYVLTTALVIAIVAGATYIIVGPTRQNAGVNDINGCATGSPCQEANSYLAAYTGGK